MPNYTSALDVALREVAPNDQARVRRVAGDGRSAGDGWVSSSCRHRRPRRHVNCRGIVAKECSCACHKEARK